MDIHHMVTDGTSYLTLFPQRDLPLAYEGKALPVQEYGMLEAAEDENARLGDEDYLRAKEVMKEKYAGVDLATLSARPENPVGEMGQESAYINRPMVDDWCKENGFAPYQLFQASFSYVLARLLREEKVAYTTIYHGRRDQRVRQAYAMFVSTIPFMMEIKKGQSVREYIASVHAEMKATLSQLAYPFTHFCRDMGVQPGILEMKAKNFVFCFAFLSVCITLPSAKIGGTSEMKAKNFVFCFAFLSVCTIFALMIVIRNRYLPLPGFSAINLCGVLFCRRETRITPRLLNHERIHTAQILEMGVVFFYIWYVVEWLVRLPRRGNAYLNISFEREAYRHEWERDYLKHRRLYAWRKYLKKR